MIFSEEINTITVLDADGKEHKCDILFTFEDKKTGKNYIAYTDCTVNPDGTTQMFASIYNPDPDDQRLYPIETEEEWETVEKVLQTLQEKMKKGKTDE